jgi:hypothetical protein
MPSYAVVRDVLKAIGTSVPKKLSGFPPCQVCGRKVKYPIAATDGLYWYFGHNKCLPDCYWILGADFNRLEKVLDWAFHLSEKSTLGRGSWLDVVAYVRPEWEPAAREVMHRFFATNQSSAS